MTTLSHPVPAGVPAAIPAYFEAINAEDWGGLGNVLAADVVVCPPGMDEVTGRAPAVAHYQRLLAGFAEHVDDPTRYLVAGDAVTVEIDFHGRTDDGRAIVFAAVDVFDVVDDQVARVRIFYDTHGVLRQLRT